MDLRSPEARLRRQEPKALSDTGRRLKERGRRTGSQGTPTVRLLQTQLGGFPGFRFLSRNGEGKKSVKDAADIYILCWHYEL